MTTRNDSQLKAKHLLRYISSKVRQMLFPHQRSMTVEIEVNTTCNRFCSYCPREEIPKVRTLGDIDPHMAETLLKRLGEFKRDYNICLGGIGEPLLYGSLIDFLTNLNMRTSGVPVTLFTNGILLDDKMTDLLLEIENIVGLVISLNIPTRDLYEKYHGNDTYDLVCKNIINFLDKKGDKKPATYVRLMKFNATMPHIEEAHQFWNQHISETDFVSIALIGNWNELIDEKSYGQEYGKNISRTCRRLASDSLTITKEGSTFSCNFGCILPTSHPTYLGNIENHTLQELLEKKHEALKCGEYRGNPACCGYRYAIDPETGKQQRKKTIHYRQSGEAVF